MRPEEIPQFTRGFKAFGRPVAYYPNLGKALKNKSAALIICQFIYWEGKQDGGPGEFVKSYPELMLETGLTEAEIDNGRKCLTALKIATAKAKGNPAKLNWKVDFEQLDKVLYDWHILTAGMSGRILKEAEPAADRKAAAPDKIPANIYTNAVESYFEFCQKPEIMGTKPLFGAPQGKALKDILTYLKTQSQTQDWPGALATWEYLLLSWGLVEDFYKKQIDILNIRKNINNIISSLKNAGNKQNKQNNRVNYANAAAGY